MANKDYVKRGSSPKKKTPPKSTPSKRHQSRNVVLAVILVSAFGYGLYTLSHQPEPKTPEKIPTVNSAQPRKSSAPAQEKNLPPPPAEKWDYVESLPKREIEVTPKALKVSDVRYVMQCGAYKTMAQAEKRKLDIAFQGLTSKIRKKEGSSWYRVTLGPYKSRRHAERDKHKLQRAKLECVIWKDR